MTDVSGVSNSILEQFSAGSAKSTETNQDKADFLKLLVAQLQNQDPLSPQDNGEFLSQLAQFSTVEGIDNLNKTMDNFASSMISNQALQATALVGRTVQIESNVAELTKGSALTGTVDLPASTSNLTLSIYDASGALVRTLQLGAHEAGPVRFSWDGINSNGEYEESGPFAIFADANQKDNSEGASVNINANVDSVTMASQGNVLLNLEGSLGSIALKDVIQIN